MGRNKGSIPPNKATLDDFIIKAREKYGDLYDYSESVYVNSKTRMQIRCTKHDVIFMQAPQKHLVGYGCKQCAAEHREKTCLDKYGVSHFSQADSVKEKKKQTNLERRGVENPMQSSEVREKYEKTNLERYGTAFAIQSDTVREKIVATMNERYGGNGAMCSEEVREKVKQTNLVRRGVENAMQAEDVQERQKASLQGNFGCDNPMRHKDLKEKQLQRRAVTMMEEYGASSSFGSPELREKAKQTNLERYGAENVMMLDEFKHKNFESRKQNGTAGGVSLPEDELYVWLCELFSEDDVERQYLDERYPWFCDFHIKSRDLFIELNGVWDHGYHWFGSFEEDDRIAVFRSVHAEDSARYASALETWCVSDVLKREKARGSHLNYLVLWDTDLIDFEAWVVAGCPDAADYVSEYSWADDEVRQCLLDINRKEWMRVYEKADNRGIH